MRRLRLMSQTILLRCYNRMLRNPLKTYILKDFGLNSHLDRVYLTTLVKLGLAEEVEVIYKMGVNNQGTKNTKGYRLSKQEQEKVLNGALAQGEKFIVAGRNWIEQEELKNVW